MKGAIFVFFDLILDLCQGIDTRVFVTDFICEANSTECDISTILVVGRRYVQSLSRFSNLASQTRGASFYHSNKPKKME